ncbi:adenylate/guanylate cyclase domain-containing protein [Mycobacterium sp. 1274761.0]|uniref:adenylate/guanylate cyclase domain-containing protein n=1 Tax=Mycobacterium sp. 1274761.0 TaxID=1834077 RepID=UPI0007FCA51F|nr:adenylate/guanylate cyclase domain-containing protein [Mycobacterium sp. 1274761.0]OBK79528.1 hydrolase [Mycobacterium sp. 1274761.0]
MKDGGVHYARNGSVRLAYRVFGEGDTTLVWIPGWISNADILTDPDMPFQSFLEALSRGNRLVAWDKRGTGLSDPVTHVPPLDERMDDLHAVLDAVGAESAALFGVSEGGPMSILFAATYPERVQALTLYGTMARFTPELPHHPWGFTEAQRDEIIAEIENHWGEGALAELFFGEVAKMPGFLEFYGRIQRFGASPAMCLMLWHALLDIDVSGVLSSVHTPTLILGRAGDAMAPIGAARALASAMPNARFLELPNGPHGLMDDALATEVVNFVLGRPADESSERVLSTVLFSDIVGSTAQVSTQGDAQWRRQLDAHDRLVDWLVDKYGGRRVKHTGDGMFALFDGPTRASRCGLEMVPALAARGIRIRVGVHTGECERRGEEWSGVAVHVGARIGALAGAGEVVASRTVRDLSAGSGLLFDPLGGQQLKGISDAVEVFRVTAPVR